MKCELSAPNVSLDRDAALPKAALELVGALPRPTAIEHVEDVVLTIDVETSLLVDVRDEVSMVPAIMLVAKHDLTARRRHFGEDTPVLGRRVSRKARSVAGPR